MRRKKNTSLRAAAQAHRSFNKPRQIRHLHQGLAVQCNYLGPRDVVACLLIHYLLG